MSVSTEAMMEQLTRRSWWQKLDWMDWGWLALLLVSAGFVHYTYQSHMDGYEVGILYGVTAGLTGLGWFWRESKVLILTVAVLSLLGVWLYQGALEAGLTYANKQAEDSNFFLKYFLASQNAISWMSAFFFLATGSYWLGLLRGSEFAARVGSRLTWLATVMGLVGLMVRWKESYLMGPDIGHIPVSNLYEVFVLFTIITAMIYLYYEKHYANRSLGAFVSLVISAAVGFILWYTYSRGANQIQPLVPALQSYWMKIHVPANFIGYGSFALASMIGVAYLLRERAEQKNPGRSEFRLPSLEIMDDLMYKSIALGFAFFTIATILGAMWAAEAWGGYWSWDPKETWALIVWLNYAAWLHLRLTKGWRGAPMAWWAIIGLFVTLFAFLGVNMFLSGLHSYGTL